MLVDRADARHQDGREEREEAPEDERVHQPGHEPLEQLALAEHDRRLVAHPARQVVGAVERACGANQAREEQRAPAEEHAGDDEQCRKRDGAYVERAFLSSAVIAGTISCRSPITA